MSAIWLTRGAFAAAAVSCGFTAYFGYTTAGDSFFAKYLNAAGGILISLCVPTFFWLFSMSERFGSGVRTNVFLGLALLFGVLDAGSNAGALFAMREGSRLNARHSTAVAQDARGQVAKLTTEVDRLRGEIESRATLKEPAAYDAEILRLKNTADRGSNVWQRTKQCTDTTLEVSEKVCQAIAVAMESRAEAERKVRLEELYATNLQALTAAKASAEEKPGKVSPIDVISSKIGAVATWSLEPGRNTQEFVFLLMTITLGSALTIVSGGLGYGASWLRGPSLEPPEYDPMRPRIAAAESAPPAQSTAIPLRSVTINHNGRRITSNSEVDRLLAEARAVLGNA